MNEYDFTTVKVPEGLHSTLSRLEQRPSGLLVPLGIASLRFFTDAQPPEQSSSGIRLPSAEEVAMFAKPPSHAGEVLPPIAELSFTAPSIAAFAREALATCRRIRDSKPLVAVAMAYNDNSDPKETELVTSLQRMFTSSAPAEEPSRPTGLYL